MPLRTPATLFKPSIEFTYAVEVTDIFGVLGLEAFGFDNVVINGHFIFGI
jgi:hypothetical protein